MSRISLFCILLCVVGLLGCSHDFVAMGPSDKVVAIPSSDVADLTAYDVIMVMRRAGFSDNQILDLGTDLKNQLATSGSAQVRVKKRIQAIFAVKGKYLFVTSRLRGSFIYDLNRGQFKNGS